MRGWISGDASLRVASFGDSERISCSRVRKASQDERGRDRKGFKVGAPNTETAVECGNDESEKTVGQCSAKADKERTRSPMATQGSGEGDDGCVKIPKGRLLSGNGCVGEFAE